MSPGWILAGRYRLLALLGQGGMGQVWRAEHLELQAHVAVKLMGGAIASSADAMQRFHREARAAAALRSPHVVQILDYGTDPATGIPFIAMELMEGESLAQRIARYGRLWPADTARIVTHIARALARAHEAGIVHRDLKPDNVFLVRNDDEEIAKVLDFGIAKAGQQSLATEVGTRTGAMMGTPYYMSPEQIEGARDVDYRTDLWALGVIAFECLTGRRPFESDTLGSLVLTICTRPLPRPSEWAEVPPGFDHWFARALDRDLARRFQSARELADELRAAFGMPAIGAQGSVAAPSAPTEPRLPVAAATAGSMSRTAHGNERAKSSIVGPVLVLSALSLLALLGTGTLFYVRRHRAVPTPEASLVAAHPSTPPSVAAPGAPAGPSLAPIVAPAVAPTPSASADATPSASAAPSASADATNVAPSAAPAAPKPKLRKVPIAPRLPAKPAVDPGSIFDRRKG